MTYEFFLVIGFILVIFPPYLYFKKTGSMNEKVYLTLLSIGAVLILVGLNMIDKADKSLALYIIMGATLLLLILSLSDAMKAYSGKMTKYEKIRMNQLRMANEAKEIREEKNKNFKI